MDKLEIKDLTTLLNNEPETREVIQRRYNEVSDTIESEYKLLTNNDDRIIESIRVQRDKDPQFELVFKMAIMFLVILLGLNTLLGSEEKH